MSETSSSEPGWKDATLEYLSCLPVEDWPTQRELADRLSISESFYRQQLRLEGASFKALKAQIRLNRAVHLLRSGCYGCIGEVADDLGFCDEPSFRRTFMRWAGCSPAVYLIRRAAL